MRRMISDKQLNELKSKNLKIIELNGQIDFVTITQSQLNIMFPKDAQGNIYKPEYNIIIQDSVNNYHNTYYLCSWNPTSIIFGVPLGNPYEGYYRYYSWTIGPNDNRFTKNIKNFATKEYVDNLIISSLNGAY